MNLTPLENKCLSRGYSISQPMGGPEHDVAFMALGENYKAILYMNYIGTEMGEWEKYYRQSYPHLHYYRRLLHEKKD